MVQQGCPDLTWVGAIDAYASKNLCKRRENLVRKDFL